MEEVLVSGLSRGELQTHVANGKIIRIGRGIYTWREPTPMEVARILHKRWPGIMLAGSSAVQLYSKKEDDLSSEICLQACREWFAVV